MSDTLPDPLVSMVRDAISTDTENVRAASIIEAIRDGKYAKPIIEIRWLRRKVLREGGTPEDAKKAVNDLKKLLPGVLWSGTFERRKKEAILAHSGLLAIDIDNLEPKELDAARRSVESDPCVRWAFTSPSGNGVKIVFCGPADVAKHETFYQVAAAQVAQMGLEPDKSCRDLARLAFVSFDPFVYSNPDAIPLELPKKSLPMTSVVPQPMTSVITETREGIAAKLLGELRWDSEKNGYFCECPGRSHHTGGWNPKECIVHLDGSPTIDCKHNSCAGVVADTNRELRSRIGKAEYSGPRTPPQAAEAVPEYNEPLFREDEEADFPSNGDASQGRVPRPYTLWKFDQFLQYEAPPGYQLILPAHLSKGDFASLIGPSGVGKSRFVLRLAIAQILRRSFCGLELNGDPVVWALLGNENSIVRWKDDIERINPTLAEEEREALRQYLRIQAIVTLDDGFVCLDDPEARLRLTDSAADVHAGVVVLDPFGNYHPGDPNSTGEVRQTLRIIQKCLHKVDPLIIPLVLHHAKAGRANMAQGIGNYDAGNFGFGAKAIHAACRNVFHLLPGDNEDSSKLVLSCGKASNCRKFEPRGLVFDETICDYTVDPAFNLQDWRDDIEGKLRGQACSVADVVHLIKSGVRKTSEIVDALNDRLGVSERTIKARIAEAKEKGFIEKLLTGQFCLGKRLLE